MLRIGKYFEYRYTPNQEYNECHCNYCGTSFVNGDTVNMICGCDKGYNCQCEGLACEECVFLIGTYNQQQSEVTS